MNKIATAKQKKEEQKNTTFDYAFPPSVDALMTNSSRKTASWG